MSLFNEALRLEVTNQKEESKHLLAILILPPDSLESLVKKESRAVSMELCCEKYINTYFIRLLSWEMFRFLIYSEVS